MTRENDLVPRAAVKAALIGLHQQRSKLLDFPQQKTDSALRYLDLALDAIRALPSTPPVEGEVSQGANDVLAERRRQVDVEGWTPEHDDEHAKGELAAAAAAYALAASMGDWFRDAREKNEKILQEYQDFRFTRLREIWPWEWRWWKPKSRRRDLVRAGALIIAEIERLDRAALASANASAEG